MANTIINNDDDYFSQCRIADPIHELIPVPSEILRIIDTPEFQRLRELKQLGATYYVFPGGSHNRFEHSLGVYHLSRRMIQHLSDRQPLLKVNAMEIYCVSVGGLLHDIGHGPFSHVFDNEFVPSVTNKIKFRHEDMSIKLIRKLFKDNNIEINKESLDLICAIVSPSTHKDIVNKYKEINRGWLFEIVANEINGIDVDKWDYFLRDSLNLSLNISFKPSRLLEYCRVIPVDNQYHICFIDKTNYDIQILFNTRYDLFKRVYSHKTSKAVEYMICDIMKLANGYFKITDKIESPQQFMELTDNIISRIQWTKITKNNDNTEIMNNLEKAQKLIHRIQTRDLYKCVGYLLLDPQIVIKHQHEMKEDHHYHSLNTNTKINCHLIEKKWKLEIFQILKKQETRMELDDILCQLNSLSYGKESSHPIHSVYFYNARTPNKANTVDSSQISHMVEPSRFREVIFRCFVKDKKWKNEGENAFKEFCAKKELVPKNQIEKQISLGLSPKTQRSPSPKISSSPKISTSPKISKSENELNKVHDAKINLNEIFDKMNE